MEINNKNQMYKLMIDRKLGNSLMVWKSINEVRNSGYKGPVAIRGLMSGMKLQTHINREELEVESEKYIESRGCLKKDIIYSEMAAPSMGIKRIMNDRLLNLPKGLHLFYNTENIHMPEAMTRAQTIGCLKAKMTMENYCDPQDHQDLLDLMEAYPDSVIEFSLLQKPVGWANKRMMIWEVRNY